MSLLEDKNDTWSTTITGCTPQSHTDSGLLGGSWSIWSEHMPACKRHRKKRRCISVVCDSLTDWADFCPRGFRCLHRKKRLMIYAPLYPTTTVQQHYWKTHPKIAGTVWIVWAELCFTQSNEGMCRLCCFHWNVACIVGQTTGDESLKCPCFLFPSPLKHFQAKFMFMH